MNLEKKAIQVMKEDKRFVQSMHDLGFSYVDRLAEGAVDMGFIEVEDDIVDFMDFFENFILAYNATLESKVHDLIATDKSEDNYLLLKLNIMEQPKGTKEQYAHLKKTGISIIDVVNIFFEIAN